jgi:hypothetical protein
MNDTMSGTVEAPSTSSGAAETNGAGVQPGQGEAAPRNLGTGVESAGDPQGSAEGGQSDNGVKDERRNRLMVDRDELLGLRGDRRTLRNKVAELEAKLSELQAGGPSRQPQPETKKTEQDFWADPNARFMSLEEKLNSLEDRVAEKVSRSFQNVREQDSAAARLHQERSEAVKLIHSQPGWDKADDEVLIDIVQEFGLGALPPIQGAKAALALFREQRGIGDKSQARSRAASLTGAPGDASGGKFWSKAEVDRLLDIELKKPADKMNQDLIEQIKAAQAEGRIR